MEKWLERLGYAAQWISDTVHSAQEQAAGLAEDAADELEELPFGGAMPAGAAGLVASAAGGWLATRLLREREVHWVRAVVAGVIGTLVYDAVMQADQRLLGRNFDTIQPLGEALTDDPDLQRWVGLGAHYAAGVGLAVLYARYLYGRIPGPPAVQGALFGLADAATLTWGGLYPTLNRLVPGVRIPPGYAGLAAHPEITAQSLLRHLGYGVAVGLVYRPD